MYAPAAMHINIHVHIHMRIDVHMHIHIDIHRHIYTYKYIHRHTLRVESHFTGQSVSLAPVNMGFVSLYRHQTIRHLTSDMSQRR